MLVKILQFSDLSMPMNFFPENSRAGALAFEIVLTGIMHQQVSSEQ
jgi:hypothetical protein